MKPCILFRKSLAEEGEFKYCQKYFDIDELRSLVPPSSLVIGRYSVLPFYEELEDDLATNKSELINTFSQHNWIASFDYYNVLKDFTPQSWDETNFFRCDIYGPFIVKGCTNSKKHEWNRKMFARNKAEALEISNELLQDSLISDQKIIFREYIPLETVEIGINGLPFSMEYRFFYLRNKLLAAGYYWSIAERAEELNSYIPTEAIEKANQIARIASGYANFFVLDLAKTREGDWILIEINDGQMSGLSMIDPETLYRNLYEEIKHCG